MKVQLQIIHEITARLKHTKKPESYTVYSEEFFDLNEIEETDAPLVASGIFRPDRVSRDGGLLRYFDGDFWYTEVGNEPETALKQIERASQAGNTQPFWRKTKQSLEKPLRGFSDDLFRELQTSKIDEARGPFIHQINDNVRVIGDNIYTRVPEPHFVVIFGEFDRRPTVQIAFDPSEVPSHEESAVVRKPKYASDYGPKVIDLFRLDKAMEMDQSHPDLQWGTPRPKIHIPDALNFDDEKHFLMHKTQWLLNKEIHRLSSFPYDAGIAWFNLKKQHKIAIKTETPDNLQALAEFVAAYRDAWELSGVTSGETQTIIQMANDICTRWQLRPISLDFPVKI